MHRRSDEGFQALELAIMFPVVILFVMMSVGAGRTFAARNEVTGAAHAGARAGTISTDVAGAADSEARRSFLVVVCPVRLGSQSVGFVS